MKNYRHAGSVVMNLAPLIIPEHIIRGIRHEKSKSTISLGAARQNGDDTLWRMYTGQNWSGVHSKNVCSTVNNWHPVRRWRWVMQKWCRIAEKVGTASTFLLKYLTPGLLASRVSNFHNEIVWCRLCRTWPSQTIRHDQRYRVHQSSFGQLIPSYGLTLT